MKSQLREILSIFPKHCYAFAYGSAVFKQSTSNSINQVANQLRDKSHEEQQYKTKDNLLNNQNDQILNVNQLPAVKVRPSGGKMIDFIIVVDDSLSWHQENLAKNRSHYSFLKYFGARAITKIQEDFGANCYFNTLIPYDDRTLIKYGVIKKSHLTNDLLDWDHLYVSGRLQKPVRIISFDHTPVSAIISPTL